MCGILVIEWHKESLHVLGHSSVHWLATMRLLLCNNCDTTGNDGFSLTALVQTRQCSNVVTYTIMLMCTRGWYETIDLIRSFCTIILETISIFTTISPSPFSGVAFGRQPEYSTEHQDYNDLLADNNNSNSESTSLQRYWWLPDSCLKMAVSAGCECYCQLWIVLESGFPYMFSANL